MKVPQGIWTFVKRLKDPKLFGEILDKDAVEGRVLPMYKHVCIKCWQLLHLTYDSKKSSWKTSNGVAHSDLFMCEMFSDSNSVCLFACL